MKKLLLATNAFVINGQTFGDAESELESHTVHGCEHLLVETADGSKRLFVIDGDDVIELGKLRGARPAPEPEAEASADEEPERKHKKHKKHRNSDTEPPPPPAVEPDPLP